MDLDEDMYEYRFGGIARLYGDASLDVLRRAHVCIIGIGGVGSWTAEAIARAGIGTITLVDWDDICITNTNRQLHALTMTLGQSKVDVMKERLQAINPACTIDARREFFNENTAEAILATSPDYIVDAIDGVQAKCELIARCRRNRIRVIAMGGAGGRIDPAKVTVDDLSRSHGDPLLAAVRKKLRNQYDFPRERRKRFRIPCVYSPEAVRYPHADGTVCHQKQGQTNMRLDCQHGYGTAAYITGTYGFLAAARVVNDLVRLAQ